MILAFLSYFGALLIPIGYCLGTMFSGKVTRLMLIGLALQAFWSLVVWGFVFYSWRAGYKEYYWGWALLIPVNAIGFVYFSAVLLFPLFARRSA